MKTPAQQRGMTLVEIMVGITISLLLLAGVMQIYVSNKQTYRVQDALSGLQDSGRFAVKKLTEEIRSADFWGCKGAIDQVTNHLNAGAGNPFNLSLGGVSGSNDTGLNNSDTLVLQGATNTGVTVASHNASAASFTTSTVNHGMNDGDFILATDCTRGDLMQVTNASPGTNTTVVSNTGGSTSPGNATKPGLDYTSDGFLFKTSQVTYSLQAGASGEPALFRTENGTAQELIEGVENMQIIYGEDTNGDGVADRYLDAGASGLVMARVVSVRVDLTLRTTEDNISSVTNNGDKRLRRTFSATTVIRNRAS